MPIDRTDVIDIIVPYDHTGEPMLAISDHLSWDDEMEHLYLLQEKVNTYFAFLESGELRRQYPEAAGQPVTIRVFGKFDLTPKARGYYAWLNERLRPFGYAFHFRLGVAEGNGGA